MNSKKHWGKTIENIKKLFKNYSINDVATSLFASSLWLPNNGSTVKHLLHAAIFTSMKSEEFIKTDQINSYSIFKCLIQDLYKLTPDFPFLEDYVSIFDWGSIKFHNEGINYKIFYETEISHIYDFLSAFKILFVSFDNEYEELSERSPKIELKQCLEIQDKIINDIDSQPSEDKLSKIMPGNIEIPLKRFWLQVKNIYNKYCKEGFANFLRLNDYSLELGSIKQDVLSKDNFYNKIFDESFLSAFFIQNGNKYYPILPRRFSSVLINKWYEIFSKHGEEIRKNNHPYDLELSFQVAKFLKVRFGKKDFFPIVSALNDNNELHDLVFSGFLQSEDKIVFFYIIKPYNRKEQIEEELNLIMPKLNEALKLISREPTTIAWLLGKQNIVYKPVSENGKLKPFIFVVLPQATMEMIPLTINKDFPGRIIFLEQFLGIADEIDSSKEISEFIDYLETVEDKIDFPLTTFIDKYGSFKDSKGVLIPGANEPDFILVDSQWGTNTRYKTLSEFWKMYPEISYIYHPRSWKIKRETPTRIRLEAKSYFGCALYFKIKDTNIFITSPFDNQEYEEGSISNLLMECLEDYMSRLIDIISKHSFFKYFNRLDIIIFPDTLISKEKFTHIRNLNPMNRNWISDAGYPEPSHPGIRLVFNLEKMLKESKDSLNNDVEVDLLIEIMSRLNDFYTDISSEDIIKILEKQKGKRPRFKVIRSNKEVAFPNFISEEIPTLHDHKISRKIQAQIAYKIGIKTGTYKLDIAKKKLNELRIEMVNTINKEISQYSYDKNLTYLITRIDALTNNYFEKELVIKESIKHEVDYIREVNYAEAHSEFITQHRNYRYLLEKFVQIKPSGNKLLDSKSFRYFIAFVDKINEIYSASDSLNYGLFAVGLSIDRNFVMQVKFEINLEEMQKKYGEEQSRIDLGLIGNQEDRVEPSSPIENYLEDLDLAFKKDFGFRIKNMVNLLQVMSNWSGYNKNVNEAPYYSANRKEIEEIAIKSINGYEASETEKILYFLTLKNKQMLKIIGTNKDANDLPVWEYRKRPYRYTIKPLIFLANNYYWGPYSVDRTGRVWMNVFNNGSLPADFLAPNTNKVLKNYKDSIDKNLEVKALEIIKRHTSWADKINYTRCTHPRDLGDYDVLAYIPDINVLLNIECKNIQGAYCLKDAKRIREKIFRLEYENGKKVNNPGNLLKVENREDYLKNNILIFKEKLKWPIKEDAKTISIYVTRMDYWWTKFPPRNTTVKFLRIDILNNFIEELKKIP
ncbi:MAG: hypothetical protein FJW63_03290 [Actinobacteria bacterium]|nr:hypothetical protein [Actinomycetota bacterium]